MKKYALISLLCFTLAFSTYLFRMVPSSPGDAAECPDRITVYRSASGSVQTVPFEEYVAGVVAAEVPSSFHPEAIKAQAVASRTYAYSKYTADSNPAAHPGAPVCDSTHCQVYMDKLSLARLKGLGWMDSGWHTITSAVKETEGQMIYYNGEVIQYALFHSSSGGYTENCEDVFVSAVPYLRSVESPLEDSHSRSGHGVGMSQHGANGMALAGKSYKKILSHYYSGTEIR